MKEGYIIKDQNAIHFVTFTVVDWVDVFTRKNHRDIFLESLTFCRENKGLILYGYVIMSNHVHLIIQSKEGKLSDLIRDLKKYTARSILDQIKKPGESRAEWMLKRFEFSATRKSKNSDFHFWQSSNHAEEIYSEIFMMSKLNYIHMNPVKAGIVEKASHYLYCSASNYVNDKGLIEIDLLDISLMKVNRNPSSYFDLW